MDEITVLQADVLKVLASPRRLEILHAIADGSKEVGRIASDVGLSQPNVSQHLAVMRSAGIVEAEREGREVRYRLVDPDVIEACQVMRRVLERRLRRLGGLAPSGEGTYATLVRTATTPDGLDAAGIPTTFATPDDEPDGPRAAAGIATRA